MRARLALAGLVGALLLPALPAAAAAATTDATISVRIQASETISLGSVWMQFCRVVDDRSDRTCVRPDPEETADGALDVALSPGAWDVWLQVARAPQGALSLSTRVEISSSQDWMLQLPELSTVSVRALGVDGVPLEGLGVGTLWGGFDQRLPALALSDELPSFTGRWGVSAPKTDEDGRTSVDVVADEAVDLPLIGQLPVASGLARYRVPLRTPTQATVDATSDVFVRARALPVHDVSFEVLDDAGRPSEANYFEIRGPWGEASGPIAQSGTASFPFPASDATLTVNPWPPPGAPWYLPQRWSVEQPLTITEDDAFTLTLPPTVRTPATVMDADTDAAAEDVAVKVTGEVGGVQLAPGLSAARVLSDQGGHTNSDGAVVFRTFGGSSLAATATMQSRPEGIYRTSPDVTGSAGSPIAITLPESVTLAFEVRDAAGAPVEYTALMRIVHDYHRYFVPTSEGRQEIRITPGPVQASTLPICGYGIDLDRELVVTEDTTLRYRLPELIGVTVIALDEDGSPLQTQPVIQGVTTVETESGTEPHRFDAGDSCRSGGVVTGPTGVVGVRVPQPDVANVQTAWWPEPIGEASGLRLQDGDVVVVQRGHSTRGDGVPYAWLQPADSLVYGSERVLGWRPVSTDAVEFTQRVATPFGSTSESPLPSWNGGIAEPLTVPYPNGATTCVRGEATRADGESTESAWVCRTRPVDDREFEASEAWTRVRDDNAYGGSFVAASKRGSRLELRGLAIPAGERPGEVSLIAYTGQDAGTVRLRVAGQWVSAPLSLRGPGIGRPTELTVPLYWQWADTAVRGRLEVVVVSDGQRVRVDGLAWPVPPGQPFLPPL